MPDLPFGPLADVRVVCSGQALAGPFTAQLMAEFGADVLWLENPSAPDLTRSGLGLTFEMEHRNQRTLALNIPTPQGTEILSRLLADADIFVESSKGGQLERWGLGDDVLWGINPALVIVHTSGYGQTGEARYVERAAFDPIAQAYGCYLQHNGSADRLRPAAPFPGDYLTGLFGAFAALAALHRTRSTGEGESIDVAMFEVLLRAGGPGPMAYLNHGIQPTRGDRPVAHTAGCGTFSCGDGNDVYVIARGAGVVRRLLSLLRLEADGDLFPVGRDLVEPDSPSGAKLEATLGEYCLARTAAEVDDAFNASGIPCSVVYTYDLAESDSHYLAREVFTEWDTPAGKRLRGVNVVPRLKRRPGRIWRGAPDFGHDTDDVLHELGYSDAEIDDLCEQRIVARPG